MADQGPARNLVLVHTPERQALSDWVEVKRHIDERAQDIDVRIVSNTKPDVAILRWQTTRPSLVFSAERLMAYRPNGGVVYAGRYADKAEQVARLRRAGVPIPPTAELTNDLELDEATFGKYVVVKPVDGSRGQGVRLARAADVRERYLELSNGGRSRMIVQRYVEPVDGRPAEYRVLTMFGRALYCSLRAWVELRESLERLADDPSVPIASNSANRACVRRVTSDPDVIEIAERAQRAFPGVGVLGVDLVRDASTGAVLALECNPVGSTWHLSSAFARERFPEEFARAIYRQFGALELAARLLIEKTRAEAH